MRLYILKATMMANITTKTARPTPKTIGNNMIPIITPKVIFNIPTRLMSCSNHTCLYNYANKYQHTFNVTVGLNKTLRKN